MRPANSAGRFFILLFLFKEARKPVFQPRGHRVIVVRADHRGRKFFEFGRGIGNGILFVRGFKHRKIVHRIAETDDALAAEQIPELFCGGRLGHPLREDLQPGRVRVDIARKDAAETVFQPLIDGGKLAFAVSDAGKVIHVAVQRPVGRENFPCAFPHFSRI